MHFDVTSYHVNTFFNVFSDIFSCISSIAECLRLYKVHNKSLKGLGLDSLMEKYITIYFLSPFDDYLVCILIIIILFIFLSDFILFSFVIMYFLAFWWFLVYILIYVFYFYLESFQPNRHFWQVDLKCLMQIVKSSNK